MQIDFNRMKKQLFSINFIYLSPLVLARQLRNRRPFVSLKKKREKYIFRVTSTQTGWINNNNNNQVRIVRLEKEAIKFEIYQRDA